MKTIRFAHMSVGATLDRRAVAAPAPMDRAWAWGGATGRGVRVCIVDSGVQPDHPLVGRRQQFYTALEDGRWSVRPDDSGDVAGHGTACATIIRRLAPDCEIVSVRVLAPDLRGNGDALLVALEWAVREGYQLVNVSLSTRKLAFKERLHDLADEAYYSGVTLVSAAHNGPVNSYPWRFPSVISVGSHAVHDSEYIECNPDPPVDFFALGAQVPVGWPDGSIKHVSGNSFATPHIAGLSARVLERHSTFRTAQLKHVLSAVADNHAM